MKTKFGLFCLCVIAAMLLTACEIGITTTVNADGSGQMGAVMKFEQAEAQGLASMGLGTVDTLCASMSSSGGTTGLPSENMQLTQETHGNQIWCVGSQPFASLSEMGKGDTTFTINKAEISNGKFILDADLDMSNSSTDTSSLGMIQASGYSLTMYYEIVAPGTIDKSKSQGWDSINGNTARLTIMQIDKDTNKIPTQAIHVTLESSTKGGGSSGGGVSLTSKKVGGVPVWGIIVAACCCLLLVVVIVVVVFFVMKRKPKQPAM